MVSRKSPLWQKNGTSKFVVELVDNQASMVCGARGASGRSMQRAAIKEKPVREDGYGYEIPCCRDLNLSSPSLLPLLPRHLILQA